MRTEYIAKINFIIGDLKTVITKTFSACRTIKISRETFWCVTFWAFSDRSKKSCVHEVFPFFVKQQLLIQ